MAAQLTNSSPARPSGTVGRVTTVIQEVAHRGEVGIRELGLELDMSRSAVHRVMQVLGRHRIVRALPSGRYVVGARLLSWANALATRDLLLTAANEVLGHGVALTQEAAYLCGYQSGANMAVILGSWPGPRPLRYELAVGSTRPLDGGAAGKAILAALAEHGVDRASQHLLDAARPALLAELEVTRARGYSKSVAELNPAASGVGSAVIEHGAVIGAVGFTLPRQRGDGESLDELGAVARMAARQIGDALAIDVPVRHERPRPAEPAVTEGRDVARVVHVLDSAARSAYGGIDVEELAARLSTSKATLRGIVDRLCELAVLRDGTERTYRPGLAMLTWPGLLPDHDVGAIARDLLLDARDALGETISLVALDEHAQKVRVVLTEPSPQPVKYVVAPNTTAALHAGAAGKAVLAHLDRSQWPQAEPLAAYTPRTITAPTALRRELEEVRSAGYAVSIGEGIEGAVGLAAPYFVDGGVAGAITATMPAERFDATRIPALVAPVLACGRELTELLARGS